MGNKIDIYIEGTNDSGTIMYAFSPPLMRLNKKAIPPLQQTDLLAQNNKSQTFAATFIFYDLAILYLLAQGEETAVFIHHTCDIEKEFKTIPTISEYTGIISDAIQTIKNDYKFKDFQFVHFNFVRPEEIHKFYVN